MVMYELLSLINMVFILVIISVYEKVPKHVQELLSNIYLFSKNLETISFLIVSFYVPDNDTTTDNT